VEETAAPSLRWKNTENRKKWPTVLEIDKNEWG
jgi:hypothetical protein